MVNFWDLGEDEKITGEFESGGFKLIPDNTKVLCMLEDIKWVTPKAAFESATDSSDYVGITWKVIEPLDYRKTVLFQKIRIMHSEADKAKKAKMMFLAIDHNAGGELAKLDRKPEDGEMQRALLNTIVCATVRIWEMDDKKGNWIAKVEPRANFAKAELVKNEEAEDDNQDLPF